ncbi:acyl carrier protein [Pectobacterium versatile]|uniref:acyl carrier protein n=1 Tax=Pectobacterium versatile TaxID=2488639 RepID=UPI0019362497|nr:acyl carrier protein [Pectobacterium versatile]MCO4314538.1 acyl carrier protein [Pectobacterium versatile]QQK70544.1 acyl carrier protein [Pectobacterium versatile]
MRKLNDILEEVLECEFFDDISKDNCESWDSINHVNIILELQDEYDIKIDHQDIDKLLSYNSILNYLKNLGITVS